ncbi:MAG TPA: rod shape-determining protein MreC [bacterium]|nr:rod shape-determining protein MreC [bacterium]HOL66977.1 rod shape-determining protein MreC [bacterium]HPP12162.1 rod shape-determining protein MreC [bacterium]
MNGSEIHLNSEELLRENRRLRRLLHLQEKKLSPFSSVVTAEVVKIQPSVWPGQLLVNKGSRDGVKPNMVVVSPEGSLIGRVIETGETTATVFTLFHPSTKISVMVQSTREIGVLEGASLPYLLVRYLPRESHVQPGDTVITSGLSDYYPKGLVVGRIYRAVTEKNQFFLVAWVKPEAGFSQLDEVLLAR